MLPPILERREIREKGFSETVLKTVVPGRAELLWKECQSKYTFFFLGGKLEVQRKHSERWWTREGIRFQSFNPEHLVSLSSLSGAFLNLPAMPSYSGETLTWRSTAFLCFGAWSFCLSFAMEQSCHFVMLGAVLLWKCRSQNKLPGFGK